VDGAKLENEFQHGMEYKLQNAKWWVEPQSHHVLFLKDCGLPKNEVGLRWSATSFAEKSRISTLSSAPILHSSKYWFNTVAILPPFWCCRNPWCFPFFLIYGAPQQLWKTRQPYDVGNFSNIALSMAVFCPRRTKYDMAPWSPNSGGLGGYCHLDIWERVNFISCSILIPGNQSE